MSFDVFVGRLVMSPSYSSTVFFLSLFVYLIQLYVSCFRVHVRVALSPPTLGPMASLNTLILFPPSARCPRLSSRGAVLADAEVMEPLVSGAKGMNTPSVVLWGHLCFLLLAFPL